MLFRTSPVFLEKMGFSSLDELPPIAPYLPEASLLEAELAGLAETPVAGEDGPMSENSEIPTAEQAAEWAEAEASESAQPDDVEMAADEVPDQDELDRLSEPS